MRRFFLVDKDDTVAAEGVLFASGAVAVSFCAGEPATGVNVWHDIESAEYIHETLGGRRLAWYDWEREGVSHDPELEGSFYVELFGQPKDELLIGYKQAAKRASQQSP